MTAAEHELSRLQREEEGHSQKILDTAEPETRHWNHSAESSGKICVSWETANFSGLSVLRHLCSEFCLSLSSQSKNYAPGKGEGGGDPAKASRSLLPHGEARKWGPENHFKAAAIMGLGWVCTSLPGQDQGLNPQNTAGWRDCPSWDVLEMVLGEISVVLYKNLK